MKKFLEWYFYQIETLFQKIETSEKSIGKRFLDWLVETEVWKSIYRVRTPFDTTAKRTLVMRESVWLHLLPSKMPANWLDFHYSFFLGIISFYLFFVLIVTGLLLMLYYRPTISLAYRDMLDFKYGVIPYGMFMRNLHRWGAHAMLIAVMFHMLRVFLSGAYKPPRQFNWVIGVFLLVITFLLSFTGYLLPWDQLAMWAITVGSNMASYTPFLGYQGPFSLLDQWHDAHFILLGGTVVGEAALIRFYVWHCVIFPVILAVLISIHLWRVRKDEFSYPMELAPEGIPAQISSQEALEAEIEWLKKTREKLQEPKLQPRVFVWPDFIIPTAMVMVVTTVVLILASIIFDAPLEEMANPSLTPNPSKAPWYFVGLQEMLVYFDPWIAGVVLPGLIIIGLILVPYLDPTVSGIGNYPLSPKVWKQRPLAVTIFTSGFAMWFILILIGQYFRGPNWQWYWPWESWAIEKTTQAKLYLTPEDYISCAFSKRKTFLPREEADKLLNIRKPTVVECITRRNKRLAVNEAQASEGPPASGVKEAQPSENAVEMVLLAPKPKYQIIGWLALFLFYTLGMWLPRYFFPKIYHIMGVRRYVIMSFLLTTMVGLWAKIFLRLGFNIKYVVRTPWFNI